MEKLDLQQRLEQAQDALKSHIERIAELDAERDSLQQQVNALDDELGKLAGTMLNRTLYSGSKQAVAYADCANMVAKFAAQLRAQGVSK